MDSLKKGFHSLADTFGRDLLLLAIVSNAAANLIFLEVFGTEFQSHRRSTLLPEVVLEAWVVVVTIIQLGTNARVFELLVDFLGFLVDCLSIITCFDNGNHNHLDLGDLWRQHKPHVVRVDHDHGANASRGQAPRSLPDILLLAVLVFIPDFEHL